MAKKLLLLLPAFIAVFARAQTFTMSGSPIVTCSGTYLDPGGSGNYADNSNYVQTISSGSSSCVSLSFSSFDLESGFDFLAIHDGPSASSPQVPGSPFTGSSSPGTITCSSGYLTLVFSSDFSINYSGWVASISCGACPPPPPPPDMTYAWTQKTSVPAPARHRAVSITIGSRGYAGLGHINAVTDILYDDWWEYDPGTNSWTQKANFPPGPRMHSCAFTIGNYGYVGTGRDNAYIEQNDFYRYDPSTNTWSTIASIPSSGRRGAVAFSVSGKGYVATGSYGNQLWEYDPATNVWAPKAPFPGTGRSSSVGFSIGTKGYVGTGDDGGPNGDFYEYDPSTDVWTAKATLAGLPRMEAAGFSLNNKGYIGTGCDYQSGNNYRDFWQYDPASNSWVEVAEFSGTARRYMSCFVIGTRAYGCFGTSGTNYNDLWEYGNFSAVNEIDVHQVPVQVFPNPFFSQITLLVPDNIPVRDATLTVYDLMGRLVLQSTHLNGNSLSIDKINLQAGAYYYHLQLDANNFANGKLVAQ